MNKIYILIILSILMLSTFTIASESKDTSININIQSSNNNNVYYYHAGSIVIFCDPLSYDTKAFILPSNEPYMYVGAKGTEITIYSDYYILASPDDFGVGAEVTAKITINDELTDSIKINKAIKSGRLEVTTFCEPDDYIDIKIDLKWDLPIVGDGSKTSTTKVYTTSSKDKISSKMYAGLITIRGIGRLYDNVNILKQDDQDIFIPENGKQIEVYANYAGIRLYAGNSTSGGVKLYINDSVSDSERLDQGSEESGTLRIFKNVKPGNSLVINLYGECLSGEDVTDSQLERTRGNILSQDYDTKQPLLNIKQPWSGIYFGDYRLGSSPLPFSIVIDYVDIISEASDESGICQVDLYIDNQQLGEGDRNIPYKWRWDCPNDGLYEIKLVAYDNSILQNSVSKTEDVLLIALGSSKITTTKVTITSDQENLKSYKIKIKPELDEEIIKQKTDDFLEKCNQYLPTTLKFTYKIEYGDGSQIETITTDYPICTTTHDYLDTTNYKLKVNVVTILTIDDETYTCQETLTSNLNEKPTAKTFLYNMFNFLSEKFHFFRNLFSLYSLYN